MARPDEAAPARGASRENQVREIFSEIAPRYDLLNHLLSLNIDRRWRRRAVERLLERIPQGPEARVLDACAGTYDLALEVVGRPSFEGRVVASDFARPMLVEGWGKIEGKRVVPVCGDTLRLPFRDGSFHGAVVGFGVRNLADLDAGLRELHRVLARGGRLVILEFTVPPNPLVRALYLFYFDRVLPLVGRIVSGHPWAYTYLPESVREFPSPEGLGERLKAAGFATTSWELVTLGIAAIHVGDRG